MPESYSLAVVVSCASPANGTGVLTCTTSYSAGGGPISNETGSTLYLLNGQNVELSQQPGGRNATFTFTGLADDFYAVEWRDNDTQLLLARAAATVSCGSGAPILVLDSVSHTDETVAGADGSITAQASGGTAPLTMQVVELSLSKPATSGQPVSFSPLPASTYLLRVTDSTAPAAQVVQQQVTVQPYVPPKDGCQDEYADNYDPAATAGGAASCTYTPRWRSAWQPLTVKVAAQAGQQLAFVKATLRAGFRPGHPLATVRPLADVATLRATVGPDGYATFVLGPYLRPLLGAPDGAGGYRLDLNSPTAYDADLYVGYELRRPDGTLLEHGYALNAAVPDGQLPSNGVQLSPFAAMPEWPGYQDYRVATLSTTLSGGFGLVSNSVSGDYDTTQLPCPPHPLPVAWLAPGGGYGFWVFQGRPQLGDDVGDGQRYREAATREQRYSDPGEAYQTYKASSGVFRGDALLTGIRTLWRSPQAWVLLGGVWVPIVIERGSREVGRLGVAKNEVQVSFQLAMPEWAQGQ